MKTAKVLVFIVAFVTFLTVTAGAMPPTISAGDGGGAADLIVITKPPKDQSATFDRSYVISGYGREGTAVAVYRHDGKVYRRVNDYSWTIGASTCFAAPIELTGRKNLLLIRAEDASGQGQNVKIEITYLGSNMQNMIKGITVDPASIQF